jgi:hypothetical protein
MSLEIAHVRSVSTWTDRPDLRQAYGAEIPGFAQRNVSERVCGGALRIGELLAVARRIEISPAQFPRDGLVNDRSPHPKMGASSVAGAGLDPATSRL